MSASPAVSVLLPSYNYARYLAEAIDSVLAQSYFDFELLILDDGSSDESFQIAERYARQDPRVIAWRRDNKGIPATLNELFARSRGQFIAQLGSDDVWLPKRLQLGVDALQEDPSLVACFCSFFVIDGAGAAFPRTCHFVLGEQSGEELFHRIVVQNCFCACTAMIRRSALTDAEPYSRNLDLTQRWDLWLRLGKKGGLRLRKEVGALYRWHDTNLTQVLPKKGLEEHRFVYENLCLPLTDKKEHASARLGVLQRLAYYCWELGERADACRYLTQIASFRPLNPTEELQRILALHETSRTDDARRCIDAVSGVCHSWPDHHRQMLGRIIKMTGAGTTAAVHTSS